jgi:hypothetical protein
VTPPRRRAAAAARPLRRAVRAPQVQRQVDGLQFEQSLRADQRRAPLKDGAAVVDALDGGDLSERHRIGQLRIAGFGQRQQRARDLELAAGRHPVPVVGERGAKRRQPRAIELPAGALDTDGGGLAAGATLVDGATAQQRNVESGHHFGGGLGVGLAVVVGKLSPAAADAAVGGDAPGGQRLLEEGREAVVLILALETCRVGAEVQVEAAARGGQFSGGGVDVAAGLLDERQRPVDREQQCLRRQRCLRGSTRRQRHHQRRRHTADQGRAPGRHGVSFPPSPPLVLLFLSSLPDDALPGSSMATTGGKPLNCRHSS